MLKKLLGKKDEFYVQLDESKAPAPETPAPSAVTADPTPVASTTVPEAAPKGKKAPKPEKPAAVQETAPPVVTKPQPKAPLDPKQVAFASADPIPQNIARRMPGPSLNPFKEMARQVKVKTR